MQSLEIWLIKDWLELEQDVATKGISDVNLWSYLTSIAPDLFYESLTALVEFLDICEKIIEICPEQQKAQIQSIFFIAFNINWVPASMRGIFRSYGQGSVEFKFDISAERTQDYYGNLWGALCATLSSSTVKKLALDAQNIDFEEYRKYFLEPYYIESIFQEPYIDEFDEFRAYAVSWISCLQYASDNDSGVVIVHR